MNHGNEGIYIDGEFVTFKDLYSKYQIIENVQPNYRARVIVALLEFIRNTADIAIERVRA